MSAFGGKADMTLCENSLLWSLLGVKRTSCFAALLTQSGHDICSARISAFRAKADVATAVHDAE
jgi:hypothetical protein